MFCVNKLRVLNASLTCYAWFSVPSCLLPVVCVDVFKRWMCHIVSHACLSLMFVVQCFVSAAFLPFHPSLPCPPCPLFPTLPLSVLPTRCTSPYKIACICARTHTHTPPACHLVGSVISSSLVVFAPSFSAFNSPSYPPFLARSLTDQNLTQQNPRIQHFSSRVQILEWDKSFWFLSGHFAVATERKTLNTAPT